jgi:nucleotide-binding universal stress UspA family protein
LEECLTSEVSNVAIEHARVKDLTMVPVQEGDYVVQSLGEAVIFGSGRPTVLLAQARKRSSTVSLDIVIIAWDFSRPAARAVADSLPILEKAKRTCVVTVSNEKKFQTKRSGAELAKHLAQHGVDITLDVIDGAGRSIGDVLESYVASQDGDLLIMGAYGHSRFREFILGGATNNMLKRAPVPVLMSH